MNKSRKFTAAFIGFSGLSVALGAVFSNPAQAGWNNGGDTPVWGAEPAAPVPMRSAGWLDGIDANGIAFGWAYDQNNPSVSLGLNLYSDGNASTGRLVGQCQANEAREDVNQYLGIRGLHGYWCRIPDSVRDGVTRTLYVVPYSASGVQGAPLSGSGRAFKFGSFTNPTPTAVPMNATGWLDGIDSQGVASGWTYDLNNVSASIGVNLYLDGNASSGRLITSCMANLSREDVNQYFGIRGLHGFSCRIPDSARDGLAHRLYAVPVSMSGVLGNQLNGSAIPFKLNSIIATSAGWIDAVSPEGVVSGWAHIKPATSVSVALSFYVDDPNGAPIGQTLANLSREDVNQYFGIQGLHGFAFTLPARYFDGKEHVIYARVHDQDGRIIAAMIGGSSAKFRLMPVPQGTELLTDTKFDAGLRAITFCSKFSDPNFAAAYHYGDCVAYRSPAPGVQVRTLPDSGANDIGKGWNVNEGAHHGTLGTDGVFRPSLLWIGQDTVMGHFVDAITKLPRWTTPDEPDLWQERFETAGVVLENSAAALDITTLNLKGQHMRRIRSDRRGKATLYFNTENLIRNVATDNGPAWSFDTWPHFLFSNGIRKPYDLAKVKSMPAQATMKLTRYKPGDNSGYFRKYQNASLTLGMMLRTKAAPYAVMFVSAQVFSTSPVQVAKADVDQFGQALWRVDAKDVGAPLVPGGEARTFAFDIKEQVTKAIEAIIKAGQGGTLPTLSADGYQLEDVGVGWEIVGNFETEFEVSNISVRAIAK